MKTYLTKTKFNTFKYQRRVPKQLINYVDINSFRVSLGSEITDATLKALEYNMSIDEAIKLTSLNVSKEMIVLKLKKLVPEYKAENTDMEKVAEELFSAIASNCLKAKKDNVSTGDYEGSLYFYNEVCPAILAKILRTRNPKLSAINYNHLLKFKDILIRLPRRNIQKYKLMSLPDIMKGLDVIPVNQRLSANSVNKYIQRLRAIFKFALNLGLINNNLANSIPLQKTLNDKLQRLPLDSLEMKLLQGSIPHKMNYLLKVLAFTVSTTLLIV